jgi:hypothetical protein
VQFYFDFGSLVTSLYGSCAIWFKDMAGLQSHLDLAFQFGMVILELSSMLLMQRTFITYSNQGNHPTSGLLFFNQALG